MRSSTILSLLLAPLVTANNPQLASKDATCGGKNAYNCIGSRWGDCCSQYGYCGSKPEYCDKGCNPAYGLCSPKSTPSRTSTSPAANTPSQPPSQLARCGPSFRGETCLGSQWGDCCSQYSYCGRTKDYCDAKTCQKGYGKCDGAISLSSSRLSSSVSSSTVSPSTPTLSASSSSSLSTPSSSSLPTPSSSSSSTPSVNPSPSPSPSTSPSPSPSSSSSPSPSPSPSPVTCSNPVLSTCQKYNQPLNQNSCPAADSQCYSDYQLSCDVFPLSSSSFAMDSGVTLPSCTTACDHLPDCVGIAAGYRSDIVVNGVADRYDCAYLSSFAGSYSAPGYIIFKRLCF